MKKIWLGLVAIVLASSLSAYELNGALGVKWTGFKLASKVGVSGGFNSVDLEIKPSDSLAQFLKSAKVSIDATSLESNDKGRNENIVSTLFASTKEIKATISSVDESTKTLILDVNMNGVSVPTKMSYVVDSGKIVANGSIDILDFDMKDPFLAFAKKCASFHEGVSYSDVNIEFIISYK